MFVKWLTRLLTSVTVPELSVADTPTPGVSTGRALPPYGPYEPTVNPPDVGGAGGAGTAASDSLPPGVKIPA